MKPINQVRWISWFGIALSVGCCLIPPCLGQVHSANAELFLQKIQPVFAAKCFPCHGPKVQKSGYRLDVRAIALSGGDHAQPPILSGQGVSSPLFKYVADTSSDLSMPPEDSQMPRLTAEEILHLGEWIDGGAEWPDSANATLDDPLDWWSFKPLHREPIPPSTVTNPIDSFIQVRLSQSEIVMSPPAEARTLARRLYFDLIGLPPSPEELDAFALEFGVDEETALDRLVDKLLAMPEYGERWARHWLDIVHYGDTHGYDKDKPRPNAWPYRDYVIRSFNEDKAYARFVEEQIAGDVLWPNTRDGIEGLGFIAAGPWDFIGHAEVAESKIDGKVARHLDRDDMVSNTMGSFCSLTVHCAQCHQHKFDPISQEDYYRLQAVFSALDRTDRTYYRNDSTQQQFLELERSRSEASLALQRMDEPLIRLAGEEYVALTRRIEVASKSADKKASGNLNNGPQFGYHSAIASLQGAEKWVQVDLGERILIDRVTILPCYDDFNAIGAGFGFPIRFKVEACDDAQFKNGVALFVQKRDQTFDSDVLNPGLEPFSTQAENEAGIAGRYVRLTAHKLAERKEDFILALAELQVFDRSNVNVALGRDVVAMDSTEAAPRWQKSNLTDGLFPTPTAVEDKHQLMAEREALLIKVADDATRANRKRLLLHSQRIAIDLQQLPAASRVFAGGVHLGSGNFTGTGATGGKPRPIFLLARGQVTQPRAEMSPGALSALSFRPYEFSFDPNSTEGQRRVALAHWITDSANPLTWRSIVNRVWQYHFGRGIVDTANDFGHNGSLPTHPELLDWLAVEFRDRGGSLKHLHRMIVKSATYRQSSLSQADGVRLDSNNTLLWRQNRRRLEAEAIRDSILSASGKLDRTMGGPGWQDFVIEHPEHSPHYEYGLADPEDIQTWRRSVYRFIVRSQTHPWMTSLDCADPSMRVDKRNESLSAIQALALLNNGFVLTHAKHFADRVQRESGDVAVQVDLAYRIAFGESPSDLNRGGMIAFVKENGLPYLCRLLFNLNAFTFVD